MLAYYLKNIYKALFRKFRDIFMGRISDFTLLKNIFSYTSKERVGKNIPSKEISLRTGEPLKETKNMLEKENDKQVRMSIGGQLENKDMVRDENGKQVRTSTG